MINLSGIEEASLLETISWSGVAALFIWKIGAPITLSLIELLKDRFSKKTTTKDSLNDHEINKLVKAVALFSDEKVLTRLQSLEKVISNDYLHEIEYVRSDINQLSTKVECIDNKVGSIDNRLVAVETKVEDLRKK